MPEGAFIESAMDTIQAVLNKSDEEYSTEDRLDLLEQFCKSIYMTGIDSPDSGSFDVLLANLALLRTASDVLSYEASSGSDEYGDFIAKLLEETSEYSVEDLGRARIVSDEIVLFYSIASEAAKEHTAILFCDLVVDPDEEEWESTKQWVLGSFSQQQRAELLKRRGDLSEEIARDLSNLSRIRNSLIHNLSGHNLLVSDRGKLVTEDPEETIESHFFTLLHLSERTDNPFPLTKILEFSRGGREVDMGQYEEIEYE